MGSVIDRETYSTIRKAVDFTEEEFMMLPDGERKEWTDACRLARILDSECHDVMFEGYKDTEMYSDNGTFNLSIAACMVRSKKRELNVIEKYTDIDLTPAQFILMGQVQGQEFANEALKKINLDTAREVSRKVTRSKSNSVEMEKMFNTSGNVVNEAGSVYTK